jgi:hypothetical protein
MGHWLSARPNFKHGDDFGAGVNGESHPQGVMATTDFRAELIQLDVQEFQSLE